MNRQPTPFLQALADRTDARRVDLEARAAAGEIVLVHPGRPGRGWTLAERLPRDPRVGEEILVVSRYLEPSSGLWLVVASPWQARQRTHTVDRYGARFGRVARFDAAGILVDVFDFEYRVTT